MRKKKVLNAGRKFGVIVLALAMALSCVSFAFADTYTVTNGETGSWEDSGQVVATYEIKDSFVVTIPADFDTSTTEDSETVTAENVMIASGKQLEVSVDSLNDWMVVDEADAENKLSYKIALTTDGTALVDDDVVLTVLAGAHSADSISQDLYHKVLGTATKSGVYKDTISFTCAIVDQD